MTIPVTALFATKMLVTQSPPDSRKRSRKPEFMLCHGDLKKKKQDLTWTEFADHFKPSDKQYDRYSRILQTCLKDDAFQTSFTAWRHPGLCRGFIESARSVVQPSKSQKDWLSCTSNRRVLMHRYSLTNTRSRKSVA